MKLIMESWRRFLNEEKCWDGYGPGAKSGVKTKKGKAGKRVNNCEPIDEEVTADEEDELEDIKDELEGASKKHNKQAKQAKDIAKNSEKSRDAHEKQASDIKRIVKEEGYYEVDALNENEEYCPVCVKEQQIEEEKKKPSKGKRFVKVVKGKGGRTRKVSYGQAGKAKGGGDRIRPGTAKGDAYCARSAKIKKCKNPPCANTLSRKKWKCKGNKSVAE